MTRENVAQMAHEINRAFCQSISDDSQPIWEEAEEWQKSSAINDVDYHLKNLLAKPSDSHDNWLKQKEEDGWKYGKVKNADKKEHPCFVPYDELPIEQKSKDYLFKQVVHSLRRYLIEESDDGIVKTDKSSSPNQHLADRIAGKVNEKGENIEDVVV